jgi:hypothetical protein
MPYKDLEVRRTYLKIYNRKNKAKLKAYFAAYHLANRGHKNAQAKAYYRAHTQQIHEQRCQPKTRFGQLRYFARKRQIPRSLTLKQYVELTASRICHYDPSHSLPDVGHGLDRKNSKLGYSVKNCVPCCKACNEIRGHDNISYEEMLKVAKLLHKLRTKTDAGDDSEEYF